MWSKLEYRHSSCQRHCVTTVSPQSASSQRENTCHSLQHLHTSPTMSTTSTWVVSCCCKPLLSFTFTMATIICRLPCNFMIKQNKCIGVANNIAQRHIVQCTSCPEKRINCILGKFQHSVVTFWQTMTHIHFICVFAN